MSKDTSVRTPNHKYQEGTLVTPETKQAYQEVQQLYKNYEEYRLSFCNWVESHHVGNWEISQKSVNQIARWFLNKKCRKSSVPKKGRFWIARDTDDSIWIYAFMRDNLMVDFWWIFAPKKERTYVNHKQQKSRN